MPLRVWNGSAYVAANLPRVNAGDVPKAAYIWNGGWVQVWPEEWFYEEWNYAHQSAGWGTNMTMWTGHTGQVTGSGVPTTRSVSGTTSKFSEYGIANATATQDDQIIEWNHTESTYHSAAADNEYGVGIRCNSAVANASHTGVWVFLMTGKVGLYRTVNGTQTAVNALFNYTVPYNTRLRWSAVGNQYTLTRLDTMAVITSWNDSTGLSPRGAAQRRLVVALSSNRPIFQVQYQSPTVDNMIWKAA